AAEIGLWDVDPLSDTLYWPPRVKAMFGISADAPVSMAEDFFPCLHPEDRDRVAEAYAAATDPARRALYDVEYRTIGKEDGQVRWVAAKGRGLFDERGECYRVIGTAADITARKQAERDAARQAQTLQVLNATGAALAAELDLEKVVQIVTDAGVGITGAQFGAFFYNLVNEAGESYTLYTLSGVDRSAFERFPMPRNTEVFAPTFEGSGVVRSDDITKDPRYGRSAPYHGMPPGHLPVRSYLAVPVISRSGEVLGGLFFGHAEPARFTAMAEELIRGVAGQASVAIDNARLFQASQQELARRRKVEEQQRLLINELNHRVKNTLATVQSVVAQTSRGVVSAELREIIEGRLLALAGAHDLLTRENWEGAELRDVLVRATSPFASAVSGRFRMDGPRVTLAPQQALALAMAAHELATNAVKYGALSASEGWVEIAWSTRAGRLSLEWRERGGPPVQPPTSAGFGTRLLQRGLAQDLHGDVSLEFRPEGVLCRVDAPLRASSQPLALA
uniref:sensor histidine kinase n=1 Tax=Phenylobacterium sp. TaxID=1871053 RepID=UPI0028113CC7